MVRINLGTVGVFFGRLSSVAGEPNVTRIHYRHARNAQIVAAASRRTRKTIQAANLVASA